MLQSGEIVIILLLALVLLGPKRLPELARRFGRWTAEMRAVAKDITTGLESEVSELKAAKDELREVKRDLRKPIGEVQSGFEWTGPKPVSGPTPEDAMRDLESMDDSIAAEEE